MTTALAALAFQITGACQRPALENVACDSQPLVSFSLEATTRIIGFPFWLDEKGRTLQSTPHGNLQVLQPTLWRTCRVLANRTRLEILDHLAREHPQTVSLVAARLKLTLPVASQALRALESRGLLACRRRGLKVEYRLGAATSSDSNATLVASLRTLLRQDAASKETIFRLATGFTHPRRVEILRLLQIEPRTVGQLQAAHNMSARAIRRHLGKLEARGFVICQKEKYSAVEHPETLGRILARLAANQ